MAQSIYMYQMYIHEQMASPAFNSVCCAVSEEWTKFPLTATAEALLLHPLNISSTVIIDRTIATGGKMAGIGPHSFQILDISTSLYQI